MKLSISLAGVHVRSITPIPEIGVQVRELHVEIPEYDVNKVEITFLQDFKYKLNVTLNLIEEYVRSVHFCILYYGKYFLLFIPGVPKKTISCLISCTVKPITAISLK